MLTVNWFVSGKLAAGTDVAQSFIVLRRYRPVRVWLKLRRAADGDGLIVDINDDGTSIFTTPPNLGAGQLVAFRRPDGDTIEADSVLTLDIDQVGSGEQGENLSVVLELEER